MNGAAHAVAAQLNGLPGFALEEFIGPGLPAEHPPDTVRLTAASHEFWLDGDNIRWTDNDYRTYKKIVKVLTLRLISMWNYIFQMNLAVLVNWFKRKIGTWPVQPNGSRWPQSTITA